MTVAAEIPTFEEARLRDLWALELLDTQPEARFDRLTRHAADVFGVELAAISLIDADRHWCKSRFGDLAVQIPREQSLCAHAILEEQPLIVSDASTDARFKSNPVVTAESAVRFYAGAVLRGPSGYPVGTLCLLGRQARIFSARMRSTSSRKRSSMPWGAQPRVFSSLAALEAMRCAISSAGSV